MTEHDAGGGPAPTVEAVTVKAAGFSVDGRDRLMRVSCTVASKINPSEVVATVTVARGYVDPLEISSPNATISWHTPPPLSLYTKFDISATSTINAGPASFTIYVGEANPPSGY